MKDKLRFSIDKKPTLFNKSLEIGILSGLCAIPVGALWGQRGMRLALASSTILGGVGAIIEKSQMANDLKNGKVACQPTIWNKDLVIGGLQGVIAGSILESTLGPLGGALVLGSAIACATAGGSAGRGQMEIDYLKATAEKKLKDKIPSPQRNAIQPLFADGIIQERLQNSSLANTL